MQQYPPPYQPPYPHYYPPPRPQFDPQWVREARRSTRKTLTRVGLALILAMVLSQGISLALSLWLRSIAPGYTGNPWIVMALSTLPLYLIALPVSLLLLRGMPQVHATEESPLSAGQFVQLFFISYAVLYLSNLVSTVWIALLTAVKGSDIVNPSDMLMDFPILPSFICMGLLAPIIEEWFFRGVVLRRLLPHGERFAIVVSALVFGLFHGNFFQMFFAFTLGLVLAFVAIRTGTLLYSICIHILINTLNGVVLPAILLHAGLGATAFMGLFILGMVITGVVLFIVHHKKIGFAPAQPPLTEGQRISQIFASPGMLVYLVLCLGLSVYLVLL